MKIILPEEYREHFTESVAFITLWKKPTLLLMNQKEKECLQEALGSAWLRYEDGTCECRSICPPIIELIIKNGIIDIPVPDDPKRRLQGENRAFKKVKAGIALS